MTVVYLVQHGEKDSGPGDPGLTEAGREQAARTAQWLGGFGLSAVYSSPLARAWQTAEQIASASGLAVRRDVRLRERVNWDGRVSFDEFVTQWTRSLQDRDFVPDGGDSSRQAGDRLRAFLLDVAAVSHGGATSDLLRTLLGDAAVPAGLTYEGVPSCAITTIHNLEVIEIASVVHLREAPQ
jgi:broad specificity phosphatase PhoE